jgi:hypothetical protein
VQPFAGVAERFLLAQAFTGGETVEGDGDLLDAGAGHGLVLLRQSGVPVAV